MYNEKIKLLTLLIITLGLFSCTKKSDGSFKKSCEIAAKLGLNDQVAVKQKVFLEILSQLKGTLAAKTIERLAKSFDLTAKDRYKILIQSAKKNGEPNFECPLFKYHF